MFKKGIFYSVNKTVYVSTVKSNCKQIQRTVTSTGTLWLTVISSLPTTESRGHSNSEYILQSHPFSIDLGTEKPQAQNVDNDNNCTLL